MYYAMVFIQNEWGNFTVRAARTKGYASLLSAKRAVEKVGHCYVKKLGEKQPVWSN